MKNVLFLFLFTMISIGHTVQAKKKASGCNPIEKRMVLGISSIFMLSHGQDMYLLGGEKISNQSSSRVQEDLLSDWQISDRESLLSVLSSLEKTGQSAELKRLLDYINSTTPEAVGMQIHSLSKEKKFDDMDRLSMARNNRIIFEEGDRLLMAYDLGRYSGIVRWGYLAGYLTEQEAWRKLFRVAKELQQHYKSWSVYAAHYNLGREFESPDQYYQEKAIYSQYASDSVPTKSPKNRAPIEWRLSLDCSPD